ncbi:hypothetical protein [Massilia scottii]|uniref:hypothetical protein n=1 Tax=Massilia scottii TaxID=3057166 RepID=UPI002796B649|nr:hypothetical protein [Massilia sp. CCM 9029]MDQ1834121.1 hypothetical protein [Massilia sp. CCM 9029]
MNTFTLSIAAGVGASVMGASFAHAATAIVSVHAAAPQVIVVEVQSAATNEAGGTATKPDLLDLTVSKWLVNSRVALGISRMSTPYDEQKALTNASATCAETKPNACVIEPATGALALSGLASNTVCVQRTGNWAQQRVVNGTARFATPQAAPGTRVYGFSAVNSYGACTTKVAQLSCEMP